MCLRLNAASIAVPSGAEAGHSAPSGRVVPAEGLRPVGAERSRPRYALDEGFYLWPVPGTTAAIAALKAGSASIAFQAAISEA